MESVITNSSSPWQTVRIEKDGVAFQGRYRVSSRHITVLFRDRAIAGRFVGMPPYAQACIMLKHLLASESRAH